MTAVVLDEADRMFEMGFEYQMRSLVDQVGPIDWDRVFFCSAATPPFFVRCLLLRRLLSTAMTTADDDGDDDERIYLVCGRPDRHPRPTLLFS